MPVITNELLVMRVGFLLPDVLASGGFGGKVCLKVLGSNTDKRGNSERDQGMDCDY